MAHIDYYFTTLSPWAYLCGDRVEKIAAKHGATITYKPLDIGQLFARTGGTLPKDRHPSRMEYRMQELLRARTKTGLPLTPQPAFWPTNGAPAAYAIIAAQKAGGGDMGKLVQAIFRACWTEEKDIAQDDIVRAALEEGGFDPKLADSGLLSGAEIYGANLEEAVGAGVFGSPFFIVDGDQRFWGQDRLDDLDAHLAGDL